MPNSPTRPKAVRWIDEDFGAWVLGVLVLLTAWFLWGEKYERRGTEGRQTEWGKAVYPHRGAGEWGSYRHWYDNGQGAGLWASGDGEGPH